jgi:hypothetical protein
LVFELLIERFQIGDLFPARRTPGGPEVHQHHFPAQLPQRPLLPGEIGQREVRSLTPLVISLEFRQRGKILRILQRHLHVLVPHQLGKRHIR